MMKRGHIFVLFLLITTCFFGQPGGTASERNKIDSLLLVLKTDKQDTTKLQHLNKLTSRYAANGNSDSVMILANRAIQLSNDIITGSINKAVLKTVKR